MKYTVITGASSGIGYDTALAFAKRGKNLILAARREDKLEELKGEIASINRELEVIVKPVDLSVAENTHKFYESLKNYELETWVNLVKKSSNNNLEKGFVTFYKTSRLRVHQIILILSSQKVELSTFIL